MQGIVYISYNFYLIQSILYVIQPSYYTMEGYHYKAINKYVTIIILIWQFLIYILLNVFRKKRGNTGFVTTYTMKVFGQTIMSSCQTKIGDNSLPWKFWNYIRPKTVVPVSFSSQGFKFRMIRQITLTPQIDKDHLVQLSIKEMMWHRIIFVIFHCLMCGDLMGMYVIIIIRLIDAPWNLTQDR